MLKFTAFKTKKPRQFEYKPRYYDPEKEARDKRKAELLGPDAEGILEGEYKPGQYIKANMMRSKAMADRKKKEDKLTRLIRITVAAALLLLIAFFLLKYKFL